MYLSAYHFDGVPDELVAAFERLLARLGADNALLQVLAVGESGVTVLDACPDRATYEQFSTSPEFHAALAEAGLPRPRVQPFGEVAHAFVRPSEVTLVGSAVPS